MTDEHVELQVDSGTIGETPKGRVYCKYWEMYIEGDHCKHFADNPCAAGCPGPHLREEVSDD